MEEVDIYNIHRAICINARGSNMLHEGHEYYVHPVIWKKRTTGRYGLKVRKLLKCSLEDSEYFQIYMPTGGKYGVVCVRKDRFKIITKNERNNMKEGLLGKESAISLLETLREPWRSQALSNIENFFISSFENRPCYTLQDAINCFNWMRTPQGHGYWSEVHKNPDKYINNMTTNELKITKERVLEAASGCSTAKNTLMKLFPEVFEDEKYIDLKGVETSYLRSTGSFTPSFLSEGNIAIRTGGEYSHKAFLLDSEYDWRVLKDDQGFLLLLPTKKQTT